MSRRRPSRTATACFTPWKMTFLTEAEAESALDHIAAASRHGLKTPTRSYRCPGCGSWHITSKE